VLVCEDGHIFTENYSAGKLQEQIIVACDAGSDVLLGGISWFDFSVKICDGLHWINKFNGTQFLIVLDRFYNAILSQDDSLEHGTLDMAVSSLSNNKLVSFPFISVQKDTGYSDATKKNNASGFVETLFRESSCRFQTLENVHRHIASIDLTINGNNYDEYQLPTYIINIEERTDRQQSIRAEFADKPEFDVRLLTSPKERNGAVGLWNNIKKSVAMAIENDEDVILICEDDHVFTPKYSKKVLFDSIFQGADLGAGLILGGVSNYRQGIVAGPNLMWVAMFQCTQFTVVFKSMFERILATDFGENDAADLKLSSITSNKYVIHPFISHQRDFGYSDIPVDGVRPEDYEKWFERSEADLNHIREVTRMGKECV